MNSKELDKQNPVQIERFIEMGSEEWRDMDDFQDFTKKIFRWGFEDGYLTCDDLGRVWLKPKGEEPYLPLHFEYGKKLYGYRLSKKAAN